MMKILWLTNMRLPIVDELLGKKANFFGGGWLSGLLEQMILYYVTLSLKKKKLYLVKKIKYHFMVFRLMLKKIA